MGLFCSKRTRVPTSDPTPPPSPKPVEVVVVQPTTDAHAIIYKSEVESRHKEIRSMTAAKPVCSLYVENTFKPGFCRECKHPQSAHVDPYADILDDLADETHDQEVPLDE